MTQPKRAQTPRVRPWLELVGRRDREISSALYHAGGHGSLRPLLVALEHSGSGTLWVPITLACWLSPLPLPQLLRSTLLSLFVGFLLDLAVVGALKSAFRRSRPVYNRGMHVIFTADVWSFPSGHASRAFLVAFFVYFTFLKFGARAAPRHVGLHGFPLFLVFSWGVSTTVSRVFLGRHFVSDVVTGSLIGYWEACFLSSQLFGYLDSISEALRAFLFGCFRLGGSPCTWDAMKSAFQP